MPHNSITKFIIKRVKLYYFRMRYLRVSFGSKCDIRKNFKLEMGPSAHVQFGSGCVVDQDMTIECNGSLRVGDRTIFGHHCTLAIRDSIEMGQDCLIAEMVSIRDHDHKFDRPDIPTREQGIISAPVRIGRNVWLGSKVTVLKGVSIGDNAVIGANAVVAEDIPANAVAVGVPARVIRFREVL